MGILLGSILLILGSVLAYWWIFPKCYREFQKEEYLNAALLSVSILLILFMLVTIQFAYNQMSLLEERQNDTEESLEVNKLLTNGIEQKIESIKREIDEIHSDIKKLKRRSYGF